jgi:hypothetical protein
MLDLEMIEEMEALLTEAMTHAGTEKGQTALEMATYLWRSYANGVRTGLAHVQAMTPEEREQLRHQLIVGLLINPRVAN